jgi:3-oxoacyl-[acyl-carrier protein] reductase
MTEQLEPDASAATDRSRTALVVGGGRGIGRSIAITLAEAGFDIWLTYRSNHKAAEETAECVRQHGRRCELSAFDVADRKATEDALLEKSDAAAPDVVVYNAGITRDNLLVWMSPEEWNDVIDTNLNGFYNVMHCVMFPMLREKRGRIVAISSIAGQIGHGGQANYSASKAGLIGAAKALAQEVGSRNIYVNVVSPGVIETDMTSELPKDKILPLIPLKRFGKPEDVAAVVGFLCREENMYIHGQVIGVNGGMA